MADVLGNDFGSLGSLPGDGRAQGQRQIKEGVSGRHLPRHDSTLLNKKVAFKMLKQFGCRVKDGADVAFVEVSSDEQPLLFQMLLELGYRSVKNGEGVPSVRVAEAPRRSQEDVVAALSRRKPPKMPLDAPADSDRLSRDQTAELVQRLAAPRPLHSVESNQPTNERKFNIKEQRSHLDRIFQVPSAQKPSGTVHSASQSATTAAELRKGVRVSGAKAWRSSPRFLSAGVLTMGGESLVCQEATSETLHRSQLKVGQELRTSSEAPFDSFLDTEASLDSLFGPAAVSWPGRSSTARTRKQQEELLSRLAKPRPLAQSPVEPMQSASKERSAEEQQTACRRLAAPRQRTSLVEEHGDHGDPAGGTSPGVVFVPSLLAQIPPQLERIEETQEDSRPSSTSSFPRVEPRCTQTGGAGESAKGPARSRACGVPLKRALDCEGSAEVSCAPCRDVSFASPAALPRVCGKESSLLNDIDRLYQEVIGNDLTSSETASWTPPESVPTVHAADDPTVVGELMEEVLWNTLRLARVSRGSIDFESKFLELLPPPTLACCLACCHKGLPVALLHRLGVELPRITAAVQSAVETAQQPSSAVLYHSCPLHARDALLQFARLVAVLPGETSALLLESLVSEVDFLPTSSLPLPTPSSRGAIPAREFVHCSLSCAPNSGRDTSTQCGSRCGAPPRGYVPQNSGVDKTVVLMCTKE